MMYMTNEHNNEDDLQYDEAGEKDNYETHELGSC